ncbi:uncharacterized protein BYT42DRAFT_612590 [Radiomyces spectabilis]|uniref:uncharacterized protein n=1 Tax=Radiomyces spectabilis TaxID=64574 RepID=UPI0022206C63|nr:uncharacterized protein BYT42DRAFT_612590 [Radiomyces spectabilis]KAI8384925.1 hypothetical protein BYT42DRAFT_612590 [Radiomyces spectabilis]
MFKQTGTPTDKDGRDPLDKEFTMAWNQHKVTEWLKDRGWHHIAPRFEENDICFERFLHITLAELGRIVPRPFTTYSERRRLLNEIRALTTQKPTTTTRISINTNLHTNFHSSNETPSANTPTSGHLPSNSPATPSSGRTACECHPDNLYPVDPSRDSGIAYLCHSPHHSAGPSPLPSPSSSEFSCPPRTKPSPTRAYSPKAAFSKLRNAFLPHAPSVHHADPPPTTNANPVTHPSSAATARTNVAKHDLHSEPDMDERTRPTIPLRVSSTPDKISRIWANYSQWHSSNRAFKTSSGAGGDASPVYSKRVVSIQNSLSTANILDHRIQVTSDKDTWYSLNVTEFTDPNALKDSILKRVQLAGERDQYCYFHENGPHPNIPLSPKDLMRLCSIADYTATHRILVLPANQVTDSTHSLLYPAQVRSGLPQQPLSHSPYQHTTFASSTPELGHSPSETTFPCCAYGNRLDPKYATSYAVTPHHTSPNNATASYRTLNRHNAAVPPCRYRSERPVGIQLSDPPTHPTTVPPTHTPPLSEEESFHESSHYHPLRKDSAPFLGHSPVTAKARTRYSEPYFHRASRPSESQNDVGLWAVPPKKSCPELSTHAAAASSAVTTTSLWAVPPSVHPMDTAHLRDIDLEALQLNDPSSSQHFNVAASSSQDDRADQTSAVTSEFWGERPPTEVVFQNMEKYFDDHDLDKEVVVEQEPQPSPHPSGTALRRYPHTKSIRLVAREASRRLINRRQHKHGSMLRRKSTKLWGQRVVEVKPLKRLPSLSEHMSMAHDASGDKPVQWIRGKLIGKGSFGRVYLAFNVATGEVIAVKQVEIAEAQNDRRDPHQQNSIEALHQEITLLRDLDHDNIVQYLGYGEDEAEGVINIFLEYVAGGSIASRLALHGAFEEPLVRHFTRQISLGLAYLHSKNILHRDIKAANILVEADGQCKISDFGLSKKNDYDEVYDQNSRMSLRGSIYWMAPEVVKNEPYSAKVDIWSLGCTVIEMFTGQRPWLTLNQIAAIYNLGRHNTPDIPDHISPEAKSFLELCLTIDPQQRPTAADLLLHPFCYLDPSFEFTEYVVQGRV